MNCGVNVDIISFYQKGGLLEGSKKSDLGPPKEFFKTVSIPAFVSLSLKKHENNILYFIIFWKCGYRLLSYRYRIDRRSCIVRIMRWKTAWRLLKEPRRKLVNYMLYLESNKEVGAIRRYLGRIYGKSDSPRDNSALIDSSCNPEFFFLELNIDTWSSCDDTSII